MKGKLILCTSGLTVLPEPLRIEDAKIIIAKLPFHACMVISARIMRKLRRQTLFLTETQLKHTYLYMYTEMNVN